MKHERLYTYLCATGISFCLAAGAVGAMATGLDLPVKLDALVIFCLLLAAIIAGLGCLRHGSLIALGMGGICLLSADLLTQLKTLAAAVAQRLQLGYGIPIPEFLQGDYAKQVLPGLCFVAGVIALAAVWAVQQRKTAIPAALLCLLPLGCCITVTDTVPDSGWLFLWGLGLVLLLMTQGVRQKSVPLANQLTAMLLIPTLLVLLLLFRLVPRNAPDRWNIANLPQRIVSYFSEVPGPAPEIPVSPPKVDLSALGKRQQKQTPVMDVTADFTGALYLRGRDYDQYTGTGWHSTPGRTEELYGFSPDFYEQDGSVVIRVRQSLDYYYLPAVTRQIVLITDGQASNPSHEKTYRFEHCTLRTDWQSSWNDSPSVIVNPRYLTLPDDTINGAWAYLNARKPDQSTLADFPAPDMAELIRQWLRQHVPYDLSTPNMPADQSDLAMWFLNDAQTGYCVHYATAAVVLLRAAGIPARYVEGYAVSVEQGKTVTVREKDAHAWAEYYVNGVGWLVLEATPGGTTPEEPAATQPSQTQPVTTNPTTPTPPTTTPDPTGPFPDTAVKTPPRWIRPLLLTLLWSLAALALLWTQYRLRRKLFRQATRRGSPNRRALVIHRRLCRLSKWIKQPVPPELTQLAQKARFSHHTLTKPELSQLQGHLKLTESAVSLLPPAKRLIAKWLFARY